MFFLLEKPSFFKLDSFSTDSFLLSFLSSGSIETSTALLGSKTLGTDVIEFQFLMCWQTMIKTSSLGLGLLKVCLFVKLESSDCRIYWTKSARLDRLNHVQIYFSAEFPIQPKPV